jgi:hypothetical protein
MFGRTYRDRGTWAAIVGFIILAFVILTTGWGLWGANRGCPGDFIAGPPGSDAASAWIYAADGKIRLGRDACLYLKPERFFRSELAALSQQKETVAAAEAALKIIDPASSDADVVKARNAAKAKLTQAQAALALLPQRRKVFLYLDDVKVPMEAREVDIMPRPGRPWIGVDMPLRSNQDAASEDGRTWRRILAGPTDSGRRMVGISVAVAESDDKPPLVRAVLGPQATLQVFDLARLLWGVLGLALLTGGIVTRGWNTGLLRDGGPGTTFSLGRVQMGWWLVLSLGGFLFIWLVSGQWEGVVTSGVIGLLGISATTGIAARMVDTQTDSGAPCAWPSPPDRPTGFWADIVNDGDGAGLHRIQLIAWTVVLGAVFIWTVVWTFGFPDFDTNLLLLAGIAGGTYLGFKFQEPDSPDSTQSPPD